MSRSVPDVLVGLDERAKRVPRITARLAVNLPSADRSEPIDQAAAISAREDLEELCMLGRRTMREAEDLLWMLRGQTSVAAEVRAELNRILEASEVFGGDAASNQPEVST